MDEDAAMDLTVRRLNRATLARQPLPRREPLEWDTLPSARVRALPG